MSHLLIDPSVVNAAREDPNWDLGNKTLYTLCEIYPDHESLGEIIAKVWLIGRSYSVALERIRKKTGINDDFYVDRIAPLFKDSELDERIKLLKRYPLGSDLGFKESLRLHNYLVIQIGRLESAENYSKKRSFCSKYLHFHMPELFYIFDSRGKKAMSKFKLKYTDVKQLIASQEAEEEYAQFASRCRQLKALIEQDVKHNLTNRQLDNILIKIANNDLRIASDIKIDRSPTKNNRL